MGGVIQGLGSIGMAQWNASAEAATDLQQEKSTEQLLTAKEAVNNDASNAGQYKARMQGTQMVAAQKLAYSNSGIDSKTGTAAQVQANTAGQSELDAQTIKNNATREAWGLQLQRTQAKTNLQTQYDSLNRQVVGADISGAASIVGGAAGSGGGGG